MIARGFTEPTERVKRLKRAIVTKEYRLITKYFGTIEEMGTQIQAFLDDYLSPVEGGHSDE